MIIFKCRLFLNNYNKNNLKIFFNVDTGKNRSGHAGPAGIHGGHHLPFVHPRIIPLNKRVKVNLKMEEGLSPFTFYSFLSLTPFWRKITVSRRYFWFFVLFIFVFPTIKLSSWKKIPQKPNFLFRERIFQFSFHC